MLRMARTTDAEHQPYRLDIFLRDGDAAGAASFHREPCKGVRGSRGLLPLHL